MLTCNEVLNLDSSGKIGRSLTAVGQTADGGRKSRHGVLLFSRNHQLSGFIGGSLNGKRGKSLSIGSGAEIDGKTVFDGEQSPPTVCLGRQARLQSPEFTKAPASRARTRRGLLHLAASSGPARYAVWAGAGHGVLPQFAKETVESGGQLGAAFGLGVLVFFGLPIASFIACVTIVGLLVGLSSLMLWFVIVFAAEVVVGGIVGQWIMGRDEEFWPFFRAHGGWCDRGAHRHQHAVHRILGRPGRGDLGHGRHFPGALSPAAADAGAQHSVYAVAAAEFAAAAAHHGGRHLVNVGGI